MSYKFIPVNAGSKRRPLVLAVVDEARYDAVSKHSWVSDDNGIVFRTAVFSGEGGPVRVKCTLAWEVASLVGFHTVAETHVSYKNQDPLDCRAENIFLGVVKTLQQFKWGSVVTALSGHAEALKAAQAAGPTRGRRARLTPAQTLAVLDECVYGSLKGATCATISDFIADRFNVSMHRSQVGQMVDGKCLRVAKFNYAKLRKTRPSPTARALERAKTL